MVRGFLVTPNGSITVPILIITSSGANPCTAENSDNRTGSVADDKYCQFHFFIGYLVGGVFTAVYYDELTTERRVPRAECRGLNG